MDRLSWMDRACVRLVLSALLDKRQEHELRAALHRALNTWTEPPAWIVALYDELRKK